MAEFENLGDLVRRDQDMSKVAIIDLGGEEPPCENELMMPLTYRFDPSARKMVIVAFLPTIESN